MARQGRSLVVLRPVGRQEEVEGALGVVPGFGHPDVLQVLLGFLLQTLGQLVQDVARLVYPAALLAGAWVARQDRRREPDGARLTGRGHRAGVLSPGRSRSEWRVPADIHCGRPGDGRHRQQAPHRHPETWLPLPQRPETRVSGSRSQNVRQRIFLKIRWVLKRNNGILFHGVSFLGLGQVVTSTITRIRRLQFNAVHKIQL